MRQGHGCEQGTRRGGGEQGTGIEPIGVGTIVRSGRCAAVS